MAAVVSCFVREGWSELLGQFVVCWLESAGRLSFCVVDLLNVVRAERMFQASVHSSVSTFSGRRNLGRNKQRSCLPCVLCLVLVS